MGNEQSAQMGPQWPTDVPASINQDDAYLEVMRLYSPSLARLAHGYEFDWARREDLLQDIHVALWRSLAAYDARCSVRTWVYRVAHNTAIKHMVANKRVRLHELRTLEEVAEVRDPQNHSSSADQQDSLQLLFKLIGRLKPMDRQLILLYLEEFSADAIGEVVGLSPANAATKIHRIKKLLASMFHARGKS